MRRAIVEFGRNTEGADMAVVFYAGHGMEVGGENWLIPSDAELRSDTDIESEAVIPVPGQEPLLVRLRSRQSEIHM